MLPLREVLGLPSREKALTATPDVIDAIREGRTNFFPLIATPNRGVLAREAYQQSIDASYGWMYAHQPAVRAVVDYLAQNVAQLGLKLYERVSDTERHEAGSHPAAVTMRYPNVQTPGQKFIFNIVRDHLVYGNAYALKSRANIDAPLILSQLPPARVAVLGPSYFVVDAYRVFRQDGTWIEPDPMPTDVFHWLGSTNPDDPRLGLSPLETLRQLLAEEAASQTANVELMKSGLLKPGYIRRPLDAPEWTDDAAERFVEKWRSTVKDQGRHTPVLDEGMSFEDFGVSPKDAEMLSGRQFARDEVAREYGMVHCPPESAEEREQFYADVLPPLCEMLCAFLDLSILQVEFGVTNYYFEFNLDEKRMANDRLTALTSAAGAPVLTRNEARTMLNQPPKEGGNELITPMNVIVGGKPSPQVMPIQDPNGPPQDGSHRTASLQNKAHLLKRREGQSRRRDRYASEFESLLHQTFEDMERSVRSKDRTKDFDPARWVKRLKTALLKLMRQTVDREGNVAATGMGLTGFDMALVAHYLEATAEGKAKEIVTDIELHLDSPEVFVAAKNVAAPGIGGTIATQMTNFAHVEAAKQTPDVESRLKRWVVENLEKSAHPEMHGEQVRLNERFSNGKEYPPYEHPKCQCMIEIT